jgi:putative nucleotidyltransferase with HDIG domain
MMQVITRVKELLDEHSVEGYLAGGTVRDAIMGRDSDDIDVVIGASPLDIGRGVAAALNGKFIPLDEANDIARVALYREAPLHIDLARMRGSITEDLALRDFTIDAMAVSLSNIPNFKSDIIDPFGGRDDIKARIVRSISEDSFKKDPARLLRAVRLAAEFGFTLDAETIAQIKRNNMLIAQISAERVRDELCRIIAAPKAAEWLRLLDELGLLMVIFPEMADTRDAEQPKEHYWDVLQHSFETIAAIEHLLHIEGSQYFSDDILSLSPWSPALKEYFAEEVAGGRQRIMLLKLVGLLHDVAKPQTRIFEESGRMRFFGHSQEGAEVVRGIMERLKFSAREREMACRMVEHHLRPGQLARDNELPTRRAIYRYFRDADDVAIDTIFLNLADHLAARGPMIEYDKWREHADILRYVIEERFKEESVIKPPKLIDGNDIIDKYGMTPGPEIGRLLEAVREAQASGEVTTKEEALLFVQRSLGSKS